MNNREKKLAKNTIIFGIGNFATKFISFFLVPLYTYCLTTSEYGKIDLLFTISTFLFPLLTLNITEAIFRYSLDNSKKIDGIQCIGLTCFALASIVGLISIPALNIFIEYKPLSLYFYLYLVTLSMCQMLLVCLKGQSKIKEFALGNFLNALLIAILNIIFLIKYNMGISGYFLAYIISNVVISIYSIYVGKFNHIIKEFYFDKKLFKEMTKYSLVLLPTSFMWWIINSSDRVMISVFENESAMGIYAVSYKIPSLLTTIASVFTQAWLFSAIDEKNSSDIELYTNKIFKKFFIFLIFVANFTICFIKIAFKFYVSNEFYTAWKYVPFLIIGFVFMNMSTFISTSYNVHKDSKGFLYSGIVGAISNIILNFILIPYYAVYGAAFATMCSYIIVFIYRLCDTKKYIKLKITSELLISMIVLLFIAALTYFNGKIYFVIQFILALAFSVYYLPLLVKTIQKK